VARKLALIIGSGAFEDVRLARLNKPAVDVAGLARVLSDPAIGCFDEVNTLVDSLSADVRRAIARFFAQKSRDDTLLLYYSGHGLRDDRGRLFLAAKDTEESLLSGSAIPSSFITEEMDRCRSRRQILILDCCYSGAFEQGAKGGTSVGTAEAFEGNGFGRVVLTATNSTEFAWEGEEADSSAHSIFSQYLIRGLETGEADRNGDGRITVDELYDYTYERILNEAPRQTPGKWSYKQHGDIVLARCPIATSRTAELPAELRQALESPFARVREGALRHLGELIEGSNLELAKAALAAVRAAIADDSRRVSKTAAEILEARDELPPAISPMELMPAKPNSASAEVEPVPVEQELTQDLAPAPLPELPAAAMVLEMEPPPSEIVPAEPEREGSGSAAAPQEKSTRRAWGALAWVGLVALLGCVAFLMVPSLREHRTPDAQATDKAHEPKVLPPPRPSREDRTGGQAQEKKVPAVPETPKPKVQIPAEQTTGLAGVDIKPIHLAALASGDLAVLDQRGLFLLIPEPLGIHELLSERSFSSFGPWDLVVASTGKGEETIFLTLNNRTPKSGSRKPKLVSFDTSGRLIRTWEFPFLSAFLTGVAIDSNRNIAYLANPIGIDYIYTLDLGQPDAVPVVFRRVSDSRTLGQVILDERHRRLLIADPGQKVIHSVKLGAGSKGSQVLVRDVGKISAFLLDPVASRIYTADVDAKKILVTDLVGEHPKPRIFSNFKELIMPSGLALGPEGGLWIADEKAQAIFLTTKEGKLARRIDLRSRPKEGSGRN
jgi:hypothetical protein